MNMGIREKRKQIRACLEREEQRNGRRLGRKGVHREGKGSLHYF